MATFGHFGVPLSTSRMANIPGMASQQPRTKPNGGKAAAPSGLKAKKQVIIEDDDEEIGDDAEEYENFANVSTSALETFGLAPHPSPVCEAATLSSVPSPECGYSLKLPAHVLKSGAISALQFQAVRLACARHEQKLPDGSRAGFFLGDGPGVGKGRQIAATIFNYFCRGKTKAVWVSVSSDLVVDARRDLEALGMLEYEPVRLHDLRQLKPRKGKPLSSLPGLESGILFCTYDLLCSGSTSAKKAGKGKGAAKSKAVTAPGRKGSNGLFADENLPPWERSGLPDDEWAPEAEEETEWEEFGPGSRLHQIVEWLGDGDYVIVLDECHRAKNCIPRDKEKESFPLDFGQDDDKPSAAASLGQRLKNSGVTKTARAVCELQRRCPNARVMYVSATGASEAENLCYMERLGLWGPGSAFPSKAEFVGLLKQGGIGAMELVAMELKGAGCYLARTLSWADVKFETVAIDASPEFVTMYDAAVAVWQDTRQFMVDNELTGGRWGQSNSMSQFYAAQLRFFRQLCTAAKVDTVVRLCQEALAAGMCPVIGLQSTGEARTAEYVAAMAQAKGADDDSLTFDSFVEPAALILSNFIERTLMAFPGATSLLSRAKNLVLPKNPLDDLIDRLGGADNVAEMTGRNKRMERDVASGGYKYVKRTDFYRGCSVDDVNILERAAFQEGRKKVAIISDAASAGISLHADNNAKNTAQRVQITLELAWSADKTVQQLGRTHRSNQAKAPIYKIVSTNICGEHRFASAVAHRLQQLGALTQGDRRAASASEAMAAFNLQTKWAREALRITLNLIQVGGYSKDPSYNTLTPPWLEDMMREGLPEDQDLPEVGTIEYIRRRTAVLNRWCSEASLELSAVGLEASKTKNNPAINTVLNRLLGMRVAMQAQVFGYFSTVMDKVVSVAKRNGSYDATGIIKPGCEKITLGSSVVICEHPNGAAPTSHTIFDMDRGVPFAKAKKLLDDEVARIRAEEGDVAAERCGAGFYSSESATTRYVSLALPRNERGKHERKIRGVRIMQANYFRLVRPATGVGKSDVHVSDFRAVFTRVNNLVQAERDWNKQYNEGMQQRLQPQHLITGSVLPLLKTITEVLNRYRETSSGRMRRLQLMRVETSDDVLQRFIGVAVPNEIILRDLLSAIKQMENLSPEQKFRRQQAAKQKESAVSKIAAAAAAFGVKLPAAAPAAAAGSSPAKPAAAAAAEPAIDPAVAAGMDPAVLALLQQTAAAVNTSAALLDDEADAAAAAAAAGSSGAAAAVDSDSDQGAAANGGSSSSENESDDESLKQRQSRRRKATRRAGKDRMTRADVAAAERAAAAARKADGPAAAAVVTEGLAAAGLWEDGSSDLMMRKGGAAAAGGGGTRWQQFAASAGSGKGGGTAAAAAGRGRRGRASVKDWMVSDDEDEYLSGGESSDEDVAIADSSDDDVAVVSDDSSDDERQQQQQEQRPTRRQPVRRGRAKQQQQQDSEESEPSDLDEADDVTNPAGLPGAWGAKRKRADRAAAADAEMIAAAAAAAMASLAAAGVATGAAAEEEERLLRKQRRMEHPAAKWQQRQQQQQQGQDEEVIIDLSQHDDEDQQQQQPGAEEQGPAANSKQRDSVEAPLQQQQQEDLAAAAESSDDEDFRSVDDLPEFVRPSKKSKSTKTAAAAAAAAPAAADQPAAAATAATKRRGRPPSANKKSATRAAAVAAAAVVTISSRGRIRKPKLLPDDYVTLDLADLAAPAAAAAPDVEQQQQHDSGSESEDDEPVLGDLLRKSAEAGSSKQQQQESSEAAAAAAEMPAAAAAEEEDRDVDMATEVPPAAAAAQDPEDGVEKQPGAAAAAAAESPQQQQDSPPQSPSAAAVASPDHELTEASLKSKVLLLLPEIAAAVPEGETLSVKAVRLAVESATGWKLTGSYRSVVKDTCQQWVAQQQQQQQQQQEDGEGGVSDAKLKEVVLELLKEADTTTVSFKTIRLAAAAALGRDDLPRGPLRDLAKQVVQDYLLQPEQQDEDLAAAAAKQQEESKVADQQQENLAAAAAAAESSDDEDFRSVDDLPEFRPKKSAKPRKAAATAARSAHDGGMCDSGAAAKGGSSRVAAARSKKFERFNKAVADAADDDTAAAGSSPSSSKKRQQQQHVDRQPSVDEQFLQDVEEQQQAPATAAGSSKRRRLRQAAAAEPAAAGEAADSEELQDLEDADVTNVPAIAAAAASEPNAATEAYAAAAAATGPDEHDLIIDLDHDVDLMSDLMADLQSPRPTAAAAGSSDLRGSSPVPADLFDPTPSPQQAKQQDQVAAAAVQRAGAVPEVANAVQQQPAVTPARKAANAAAAVSPPAAAGAGSRGHRRAVIADSDDEMEEQQQQQHLHAAAAADPAAAPAVVVNFAIQPAAAAEPSRTSDGTLITADLVESLQQQLAAAAAQISELQQHRGAAAAAMAAAAKWEQECKQLRTEMRELKQQQQQQHDGQAAAMQIDRSGSGGSEATAAAAGLSSPAFASKQAAAAAATPAGQQISAAAPAAAAAASTPATATPIPWGSMSSVEFVTTPGAAAEDDPPTPRMGCLAAAASITSPAAVQGNIFSNISRSGSLQQQQQQQSKVPATPLTPGSDPAAADQQSKVADLKAAQINVPTLDDVRLWLLDRPKGATAVQILQAFGGSSSKGVAGALCDLLQSMVDDLEVIRKGGAAATSSAVDMCDQETLFIPLC